MLMLLCISAIGTITTSAQSTGYDDIQIQVGYERFVLTPTPALTVHGIGTLPGALDPTLGETFYFGEPGLPALEPMSPEKANAAWRAISGGDVLQALAFTYFLNCASNPQLPTSLVSLCQVPLLEKGLLFNVREKAPAREIGTHLDRPRPERPLAAPVSQDGAMTVRKDGRAYWEGQLADGPVAVLCEKRPKSGNYECSHSRALTPTTYYRIVFLLAGENPPPSDAEWLSFSSAVAEIFRGVVTPLH
ncbi:hypothetical protein [Devosia sp. XK-2]|uniref:hypothetical protein n=1 Tax=Devosia sp. XK-2 TaxID=3126689 RepID=UPI0030CB3E2A